MAEAIHGWCGEWRDRYPDETRGHERKALEADRQRALLKIARGLRGHQRDVLEALEVWVVMEADLSEEIKPRAILSVRALERKGLVELTSQGWHVTPLGEEVLGVDLCRS